MCRCSWYLLCILDYLGYSGILSVLGCLIFGGYLLPVYYIFFVMFIFTDFFYSHTLSFSVASRLDLEPLKYMYAMAFAVEEINRNSTLLPGVKLGYHILDSCSRYPWALGAAMSLVGGDTYSCNLSDAATHSAYQQSGETKGMMI